MDGSSYRANIAICGISGLPAKYGGFETFTQYLVKYSRQIYFTIYCENKYRGYSLNYGNVDRHFIPLKANGMNSLFYDAVCIFHALYIKKVEVVVLLGCSGCWCLPLIPKRHRRKIIFHPDGIEYERKKFNRLQQHILKILTILGLRYSSKVISDNPSITVELTKLVNIPHLEEVRYGGDHASVINISKDYYIATCRVVPENNIELILGAFRNHDQNLVFIGNWNNSTYSKSIYEKYSKDKNIKLVNAVYDLEKLSELRRHTKGYIHGHSVGGTNPSLVEALFYTNRIIAYDCSYNRNTLDGEGSYFTDEIGLRKLIKGGYGILDPHKQNILKQSYSWKCIVGKFEKSCLDVLK